MTPLRRAIPLPLLLALLAAASPAPAQAWWGLNGTPGPRATAGVLRQAAAVPLARARTQCLALAPPTPADSLEGGGGGRLVSVRCQAREKDGLVLRERGPRDPRFFHVLYERTLVYADRDRATGREERRTAREGAVVLFERVGTDRARPVWHGRWDPVFWAFILPEPAPLPGGGVLVGLLACVNGTGGCEQDFLLRRAPGRWAAVGEPWWRALPAGTRERLLKGAYLDPATLRAEGGVYAERDPNCCPTRALRATVALRGDSLVLVDHRVEPWREER